MNTWTVTIAGSERLDGEAPFIWVVNAQSAEQASAKALEIHHTEQGDPDLQFRSVVPGLPPDGSGAWNDRRANLSVVVTLRLTADEAGALRDVLESAQRGRDDFNYLASLNQDDYSPEDVSAAKARHAREVELESDIIRQLSEQRV